MARGPLHPVRVLLLLLLNLGAMLWATWPASAARMRLERDSSAVPVLFVQGPIVAGDAERFARLLPQGRRPLVVLSGPGGLLRESLAIGLMVHRLRLPTLVLPGGICLSACAYIWLSGNPRILSHHALVGTHAAYAEDSTGRKRETGSGNALLGAWLRELGLGWKAIQYLTLAGPDGFLPITPKIARSLGIPVVVAEEMEKRAMARKHLGVSARQRAKRNFEIYFMLMTLLPERNTVSYLQRLMAPELLFYGRKITWTEYLRRQLTYARRWPTRLFVPRWESLQTECPAGAGVCVTTGIVEWLAANEEKRRLSFGTSLFGLGTDARSGRVIYLNGKILEVKRLRLDGKGIRNRVRKLQRKRYNWRPAR